MILLIYTPLSIGVWGISAISLTAITFTSCIMYSICIYTFSFIMFTLLLLSSLLHTTTCTVYTVIPEGDLNTTCKHCHNLRYYLRYSTKYFISGTQLVFLPGLHQLQKNLIIQNVPNVSLIGNANSANQDVIIQCKDSLDFIGILMVNISNLVIRNMAIQGCTYNEYDDYWDEELEASLVIKDCNCVSVDHLKVFNDNPFSNAYMILGVNILGNSSFNHVICNEMKLMYFEKKQFEREFDTISIDGTCISHLLEFVMNQNSYQIVIKVSNISILPGVAVVPKFHGVDIGNSKMVFSNSNFKCECCSFCFSFSFYSSKNGMVYFDNCNFVNNFKGIIGKPDVVITAEYKVILSIANCNFRVNNSHILKIYREDDDDDETLTTVTIQNTTITSNTLETQCLIILSYARLLLIGGVIFSNNTVLNSIIVLMDNSDLVINGKLQFSNNTALSVIDFQHNSHEYIMINETSVVDINQNKLCTPFTTTSSVRKHLYPYCLFQYTSFRSLEKKHGDFLIRFHYNFYNKSMCMLRSMQNMPTTNCQWLPQSLFNTTLPLDVNNEYIKYTDSTGTYNRLPHVNVPNTLCVCTNISHHDCSITDLGFVYPGQTLTIFLYHYTEEHNNSNAIVTLVSQPNMPLCRVLHGSQYQQNILSNQSQCSAVYYTIAFPNSRWCKLFLETVLPVSDNVNLFTVRQHKCPRGFTKTDGICQCYSKFKKVGITQCDINDQTIVRPSNSWIATSIKGNSEIYHISLHCPFHYCVPHSSRINLSNPNAQCQFNRCGILCGQCQHSLSTVFGSSHCQHCSSVYLLLIVPVAVTGLFLVFVLFALNLTVTNGAINGLIFYVNVISINTSIFFSESTPAYTFISLVNLDLGIEVCFYNGMDDYAKMWLQLTFPTYLILIATSLIIISRYSIRMQRLTARRALPVLATLFLLSYTKILQTVSSVLFFYSTVTDFPSEQSKLVWSLDANVALFGAKFTTLFTVSLLLFGSLIPFNVVLLFTKTLSRFKLVTKFKPLLDAFQGPYKNKFYFWTGLQLLLRAIFFGISSLERNINLIIGSVFINILIGVHGVLQPFKTKLNNYHELLFLFNLHGLFVMSLYSHNITVINIMVFMVLLHFNYIIIYQTITCLCSDSTKHKMRMSVSRLTTWISILYNKSQTHNQPFELQQNMRNKIPEVTFNYSKYQEPLLDVD